MIWVYKPQEDYFETKQVKWQFRFFIKNNIAEFHVLSVVEFSLNTLPR